jgi:hypothetical protein
VPACWALAWIPQVPPEGILDECARGPPAAAPGLALFETWDLANSASTRGAENVDQGPNPTAIHQSFMKSPQHRANILDTDMDSAGIGIAERNGQIFAVEDFSKAK